jgi:hypothetical protein
MSAVMKQVRLELGVADKCRVSARLAKLVLYGPGSSPEIQPQASVPGTTPGSAPPRFLVVL